MDGAEAQGVRRSEPGGIEMVEGHRQADDGDQTPRGACPAEHSRSPDQGFTMRWRGRQSPSPPRRSAMASDDRSEEHTSELQSLMRSSYAVFCLIKKTEMT